MAWALFRSSQIFKFGLLRKKDNKKNLKIRLVFNRIVTVYFQPYYSYTIPLPTILKKLLQIIILTLITACDSTKNTIDLIADEKFELCSEIKYNRRVTEIGPIAGKLIYKQNIHSLLENSLLKEKYLTEIDKIGYSELLKKVNQKEIKPDFFEKLKSDIGFDPYSLFPKNSHLSCYGYLFEQLHILDKSSWQYQFCLAFNKFEAYGNLERESEYLIDVLNKIPEDKFQLIMYRKLFLDFIYTTLN
ncbi:hypothetical protein [Olleya sp. Bg11-27]|uniref:hypothetical protein n=1 Tax=Olleya sp. Bg11-27 TaxID=2058135 RepID=UPI0012FE2C40|nr:hypothetical protein [Olleya sp. Bg11-27]